MAKILKTWTTIGLATLGAVSAASAGAIVQPHLAPAQFILTAGEGGEGGEGTAGGENTTVYSLNSSDPNAFIYDASKQIEAYADLAYENYEAAEAEARKLEKSVVALAAKPNLENLERARNAWVAARPFYMRTEAWRYYSGPIDGVEALINEAPINGKFIDDSVIGSKIKLSGNALKQVNQKGGDANVALGWHALEYVLWREAATFKSKRTAIYAKTLAHELVEHMEGLAHAWAKDRAGNYRTTFVKLDQREALGRIVNGMAILAGHELADERITAALAEANPDNEQSQFSDTSTADFAASLSGINDVWVKSGLATLVKSRNPEAAKQVEMRIADATAKVAEISQPWDKVLMSPASSTEHKVAENAASALKFLADALKSAGNSLGVIVLLPED